MGPQQTTQELSIDIAGNKELLKFQRKEKINNTMKEKNKLKQINLTNFWDCRLGWKGRYSYKSRKGSERRLLGNGARRAGKGRWKRKQARRIIVHVR